MVETPNPILVQGRVIWFDQALGYGFIETDACEENVLLTSRALEVFDKTSIESGREVLARLFYNEDKGWSVEKLISLGPIDSEQNNDTRFDDPKAFLYQPCRVDSYLPKQKVWLVSLFGQPGAYLLPWPVVQAKGFCGLEIGQALSVVVDTSSGNNLVIDIGSWYT